MLAIVSEMDGGRTEIVQRGGGVMEVVHQMYVSGGKLTRKDEEV